MAIKIGGSTAQFGEYLKGAVTPPSQGGGRDTQSPYGGQAKRAMESFPEFDIQSQTYNAQNIDPNSLYQMNAGQVTPETMQGMDFDPYRKSALQDVEAASASGQAGAEGQLARTGGASAADRMALASQFNRERISGRQGARGKYDQAEAQNVYDVGRTNAQIGNRAQEFNRNLDMRSQEAMKRSQDNALSANAAAQNQANRYGADQRSMTDRDRYGAEMNKWQTGGQFEGAERLSDQQYRQSQKKSPTEQLGGQISDFGQNIYNPNRRR